MAFPLHGGGTWRCSLHPGISVCHGFPVPSHLSLREHHRAADPPRALRRHGKTGPRHALEACRSFDHMLGHDHHLVLQRRRRVVCRLFVQGHSAGVPSGAFRTGFVDVRQHDFQHLAAHPVPYGLSRPHCRHRRPRGAEGDRAVQQNLHAGAVCADCRHHVLFPVASRRG